MAPGSKRRPAKRDARGREPTILESLVPIGMLIVLLSLSYYLFRDEASYGPNQVALLFCALVAAGLAYKNGLRLGGNSPGDDRWGCDGHRRHRHPAGRRRPDRDLGPQRHDRRHGLLRAPDPESQLLLRDRRLDLRGRGLQHRQLLDHRRHDRDRSHGDRRQHGSFAGHHRRRGDFRRLFRRQGLAALRHGESGDRRRGIRALRSYPGILVDVGPRPAAGRRRICPARQGRRFRCLGHAGGHSKPRRRIAVEFPSSPPRPRSGAAALSADGHHIPGRPGRRGACRGPEPRCRRGFRPSAGDCPAAGRDQGDMVRARHRLSRRNRRCRPSTSS